MGLKVIQTFCKIGSPQKLGPALWEKYSWIMKNAWKANEWQWICNHKSLKIEIQKGGENNSDFLEN